MRKIKIFIIVFISFLNSSAYSDNNNFDEWKINFKKIALKNGISEITFDKVMKNAKFLPKVIEYDRFQPEFYEDTKTYISKRSSDNKVKKGLKFYNQEFNITI